MIRLTNAICFTMATLGLLLGSQVTQAQIAPGGSVINHYQSIFGAQSSAGLISQASPYSNAVIDQYQSLFNGQSAGSFSFAQPLEITASQNFVSPEQIYQPVVQPQQIATNDILDTRNYSLLELRRIFQTGRTPQPHEMVGYWRGVNKGIVELVGYRQFIKEILPSNNGVISGDNIQVGQVNQDLLRSLGWQPKIDPLTGAIERRGKFAIHPSDGRGAFGNGAVFNYRNGGNRLTDPSNVLVDKVVILDANHMLGRATANFGPVQIPLAYFILERIQ